ncbi:MAG TPA: patatin-like phospholipase family protein, partial [Spirochaetia bacterium]|nr:patatin-like phospholipase family protein [Spirochaetia bacterium]
MSKDNQPPVSEENLKYKVFLFDDVLREELNLVSARRKVLFPRIVKRDPSPIAETAPRCLSAAWAPDTDEPAKGEKDSDKAVTVQREIALDAHLAGLAFSGGGIRSASFAIGVLQGLASLKLLNWFDYLSTVSGGGYAGGWLAAWLYREGSPINVESQLDTSRIRQSKADRHFEKKPAAEKKKPAADRAEWEKLSEKLVLDEEPEPVTHLRAYSSYLTPRGGLFSTDTWAMLAIYLRNVFINLLVLLPLLFLLVLFVRWIIELYVWSLSPTVRQERSLEETYLLFVFIVGLALGLFGLGYNARAIWGLRSTPRTFRLGPSKLFWGVLLPLLVAAALVAPSYEGALNVIRRKAEAILSWCGLGGTALGGQ